MGLNKNTLATKIEEAFVKAKNIPAPDDPNEIDQLQLDILETLGIDLANAIDDYVRAGDVAGVETDVSDINGTVIGTGLQTNTVNIG